jgi:hypothetical protein
MLEPGEAVEPRAGDSDRDAVAERLRVAAGEGRGWARSAGCSAACPVPRTSTAGRDYGLARLFLM